MTKQFKILLIGDSCVDEYYYGSCDRLNPEAPVPVLNITRSDIKQGMAANVNDNLTAFNCSVTFIAGNRKSIKKRFIDDRSKQHIVRVDEDRISDPIDINSLYLEYYDAIVISDYNKGTIQYDTITKIKSSYKGPVFVDTKKTDLRRLNGCFVKINETEYNARTSDCDDLIVTLGPRGARYNNSIYVSDKTEVIDVCGAGDTFLSALAFKYLQSDSIVDAIQFANKCSAITVGHRGVYSLTNADISAIVI